jgi:DNA-nicking Smr family endonuclease
MNVRRPVAILQPSLGRRALTADEEQLWSVVVRTVRPLRLGKKPMTEPRRGTGVRHGAPGAPDPAGRPEPHAAAAPHRPARIPALSPIVRKEKQRLARGNTAVDARIDLHGMTQTQAYGALRRLLHRSQANGAKFVLIITGKGVRDASGGGVLRRQVPMWLALPEFRRYVLGFDVADTGHGGEGALYVRMRKASQPPPASAGGLFRKPQG